MNIYFLLKVQTNQEARQKQNINDDNNNDKKSKL